MKVPASKDVLSANLTRLLGERDWVDRVAGAKAGIAPKTVNNMKNGRGAPTLDKVDAIAEALGTTTPDLLRPALSDEPRAAVKEDIRRLRAILFALDGARVEQLLDYGEGLVAQQKDNKAYIEEEVNGLFTPPSPDDDRSAARAEADPEVLGRNQYLPESQ